MTNKTPLTNYIVEVHYAGFIFTGDSTSELLVKMWALKMFTYRHIGEAFNLKRTSLWHRMKVFKRKYPETFVMIQEQMSLEKLVWEMIVEQKMTLFEIASALDCSTGAIFQIKKRLNVDKKQVIIRLHQRQNRLCRLLFGPLYEPGPYFTPYIKNEFIKFFDDNEGSEILSYYIEGIEAKESSARLLRIQKIGTILKLNIDDLREREIIWQFQG